MKEEPGCSIREAFALRDRDPLPTLPSPTWSVMTEIFPEMPAGSRRELVSRVDACCRTLRLGELAGAPTGGSRGALAELVAVGRADFAAVCFSNCCCLCCAYEEPM